MITDGNRHIDRRFMLIREKVEQGIMTVVWESGDWIDLAAGFSCNVLNITPHHMIDSSTYLVLHKVHPRLAMPIAHS